MTSETQKSAKNLLESLDLGNSVAEFDKSLEKYFVENAAFEALIADRADIIAGDKGTGKTAVFQILHKKSGTIPKLKGIEVLAGFNPGGNPIFQKLVQQQILSEGQYGSVWKAYILALVGNWLLGIVGADYSDNCRQLDELLTSTGLRSKDDGPETVFSKIINMLQRVFIKKAAVEFKISESGLPIVIPTVEFGKSEDNVAKEVPHEQALRLLSRCLKDLDYRVWLALDRLDEAFQGFPNFEIPALRALLRTYLDLLEFPQITLKLFIRRDLFRKIIGKGFVNLTHINARKVEIIWEEADLLNLLVRRIRDSSTFINELDLGAATDAEVFGRLFPDKVDQAERKPTTFNWMMSRIRDGNRVRPPRNLIGLANFAREAQLKAEQRSPRVMREDLRLITSESLRAAQSQLSAQRVEDTLLAESGPDVGELIEKFRKSKSEHNLESLASTLGLEGPELSDALRQLVDVGFLEELSKTYKVPMLYRDGLEIRQGKAFSVDAENEDDE